MKRINKKSKRGRRAAPWLLGVLGVTLLSGSWFFYKQRDAATQQVALTAYLAEVKDWMTSRRARLKAELMEAKSISSAKEAEAANIHFEFYTSLGKMQVVPNTQPTAFPDKPKPKVFVSQAGDLERDVLATLQAHDNN